MEQLHELQREEIARKEREREREADRERERERGKESAAVEQYVYNREEPLIVRYCGYWGIDI